MIIIVVILIINKFFTHIQDIWISLLSLNKPDETET